MSCSRKPAGVRRIHAGVALVFALLLTASSCRELVGVEARASRCGALPFAEASCAHCTDQACCAEEEACSEDAKCTALADAIHACPASDAACRAAAQVEPQSGNAAFAALTACTRAHCTLDCRACGGLVDRFGPECDQCVQASCCDVAAACATDSSCAAALSCVRECAEIPDCMQQCLNGPLRNAAVVSLQNCLVHPCADACGAGKDFSCAEKYTWGPGATKSPVSYVLTIAQITTLEKLPGVNVTLCNALTADCSIQGTTDENGVVKLEIPLTPPASFLGHARLTKPGYKTMLAATSKPIADATAATFFMIDELQFALLTANFGLKYDPQKAFVFPTAYDCHGFNGVGVHFELDSQDPGIVESYFRGKDVTTAETSESGTAAFMNVPVSQPYLTIYMYVGADKVGQTAVPIEAGAITQARIYPRT